LTNFNPKLGLTRKARQDLQLGVITPEEKVNHKDSVARFSVTKRKSKLDFVWEIFSCTGKYYKISPDFLLVPSVFCHKVVSTFAIFSKAGGAFHRLATLLPNISMSGDQTFPVCST